MGRFRFFRPQLSLHLGKPFETTRTGKVGDHMVMMPHMGIVLALPDWLALADRLKERGVRLRHTPVVRFAGEPGERGPCSSSIPRAIQSRSGVRRYGGPVRILISAAFAFQEKTAATKPGQGRAPA